MNSVLVKGKINKNSKRYKIDDALVFGYMRRLKVLWKLKNIPHDINNMIFIFYHRSLDEFAFNPKQCGSNVKFSDNNRRISYLHSSSRTIASNHIISSELCDIYSFEIGTAKNLNSSNCIIAMGFMYDPITDSCQDFDVGLLSYAQYGKILNIHTSIDLHPYQSSRPAIKCKNFKTGDRFKLEINFIKKNISLYYNAEFINVMFKNIDITKKYVPALELYGSEAYYTDCYWK